jgi:hypothetical protein
LDLTSKLKEKFPLKSLKYFPTSSSVEQFIFLEFHSKEYGLLKGSLSIKPDK